MPLLFFLLVFKEKLCYGFVLLCTVIEDLSVCNMDTSVSAMSAGGECGTVGQYRLIAHYSCQFMGC